MVSAFESSKVFVGQVGDDASARGSEVTFVASIEDNGKTYLDGYQVKWAEGDVINVNGSPVGLYSGCDTKNGVFRGNVKGIGEGDMKTYIAGYPSDAVTYSGGTMTVSIPATQKYDAAKPLLGQMPMLAKVTGKGDGMTLDFKNVANILKLNIYGDGNKSLKGIIIHSSGAPISGVAATCSSSGEITSCTPSGAGSSHYIHVAFDDALTLSTDQDNPTPVYVIIPKITVATTLTVKMYAEDGCSQTERIIADATTFNSSNMIYKTSAKLFSATENTHEIPALFSVGEGRQVMFTNGNIYWDGDSFEFENSQTARTTSWNASHVSHFYWQPWSRIGNSYSNADYSGLDASVDDVFFTNFQNKNSSDKPNPDFTIAGFSGKYRVLTKSEKDYLVNQRANHENLIFKGVLTGESNLKVLIICPDGFSFKDAGIDREFTKIAQMSGGGQTTSAAAIFENSVDNATKSKLEAAGAVILPVGGYRKNENISCWNVSGDVIGLYWLGDSDAGDSNRSYGLSFGYFPGYQNFDARNAGYLVRLVSDFGTEGAASAEPFNGGTW